MTYHPLTTESGGDEESRVGEARAIVRIINEMASGLTEKERKFVDVMKECTFCTVKQLFWLRDIKARYVD